MWCPICLITMRCLVLRTKSHVIDWVFLLWGGRRKEVWICCFQNLLLPAHTIPYPSLIYINDSCRLVLFVLQSIHYQCLSAILFSISPSSFNNSALFPFFPFLWSPPITNLFSPGSCLLIPHPEIIVKCLRPYTFSVITTIQDSLCKTDYPSLWKIALNSSCPSFFIL